MINLRYHVVSITAVFLALGIGLAFGAAFIDRATVDQLERNLDTVEDQRNDARADRDQLTQRVEAAEAIEQAMVEQGLGQLVANRLDGVPVLVIATRGIDAEPVTGEGGVVEALTAAGADVGGVLWLTDRLVLDDDAELSDLGAVLGSASPSAARLRAELLRQLGDLLATAGAPIVEGAEPVEPVATPPLIQGLLDRQFLEVDLPESVPEGFAIVPPAAARYLLVSGRGAVVPDADVLHPLLDRIVGPVVVAAQSGPPPDAEPADDVDPAAERVVFVGPLRDDEGLRERLSTVDDIEIFAGLVAAVLALEHGAIGQFGHYGVGEGAQSLLPAAPPVEPADPG